MERDPKPVIQERSGPPVGLIVAPILLCVLIAALIFLWIKYREHKKRIQEQVVERMLRRNQGDTESIPSATTPGAISANASETESHKPLLSTNTCQSDEPVQSPESASDSVVFTDEQSEKGQLDPIEERDDNPGSRVRSAPRVQAAAQRQQMVPQEEPPESVEDQESPTSLPYHQYTQTTAPYPNQDQADDANVYEDQNCPSESGGEHEEEEEPETFRERRYDSGYRSYRQRPYYRDMYVPPRFRDRGKDSGFFSRRYPGQKQQFDNNDSEETIPKQVVPSRLHPAREGQGLYFQPLNLHRMDFQGSANSGISDQSETLLKMPVESAEPSRDRPGQEATYYIKYEAMSLLDDDQDIDDDDEEGQEASDYIKYEAKSLLNDDQDIDDDDEEGKRLQNNVQEDSEEDSFAKKYIV